MLGKEYVFIFLNFDYLNVKMITHMSKCFGIILFIMKIILNRIFSSRFMQALNN